MAKLYPAHSTVFVQLGRAHTMKENTKEAIDALEKANGINPFDPTVHCTLKELYQTMGKTEEAELEQDHCRILAAGKSKITP
jgi:Flp pilus assembly protein TadD